MYLGKKGGGNIFRFCKLIFNGKCLEKMWIKLLPIDLEAPNAVHWKYNNLVSKGNTIGQVDVRSWHQSGRPFDAKTRLSWICWTSLFVILLELKASIGTLWFLVVTINNWRRSWITSSIDAWWKSFRMESCELSEPVEKC